MYRAALSLLALIVLSAVIVIAGMDERADGGERSSHPQDPSTSSAGQMSGAAATLPSPSGTAAPAQRSSAPPLRPAAEAPSGPFLETFDGDPAGPQPWRPTDWDVAVHTKDLTVTMESMLAMHGSDCSAPPATHENHTHDGAVFQCKDHVMTAINSGGYGMIYLTPPVLADFSAGEVVISFDVSTLRTSGRDWIDLWLTPYDDYMVMPLEESFPDGQGVPRRSVHVRMDNGTSGSIFRVFVGSGYGLTEVTTAYPEIETFMTTSAVTRSTFELHLSRTHLKFGMPVQNQWWADTAIPDLGWTQGVLQLGHHSYNPTKGGGTPNTWHWDNVSISSAVPFTMIKGDKRVIGAVNNGLGGPGTVTFAQPAPQNAFLRFEGMGDSISVSFNNGASWQVAQGHRPNIHGPENAQSFWVPVPAGTTSVQVKGSGWYGQGPDWSWIAQDFAIWSPGARSETDDSAR